MPLYKLNLALSPHSAASIVPCHRTVPHHRTAPPHQTTLPAPTYAPNNRTKLAAEIPEIAAVRCGGAVRWCGGAVRWCGAVVQCWLHRTAPPHHAAPPHRTTAPHHRTNNRTEKPYQKNTATNNRTKLAAEIPEIAAESAAISGISAANLVRLFGAYVGAGTVVWCGGAVRWCGAVVRWCGAVVRCSGAVLASPYCTTAPPHRTTAPNNRTSTNIRTKQPHRKTVPKKHRTKQPHQISGRNSRNSGRICRYFWNFCR